MQRNVKTIQDPKIRYFKGSQFACTIGIGAWFQLIIGFFLVPVLSGVFHIPAMLVFAMAPICFVFWGIMCTKLNYFGVAGGHIEIRNHNFRWWNKRYNFDEITEMVMDRGSLILVLRYGREESYQGPSLKNEQWLALKKMLEEKGIVVKDETNFEEAIKPRTKKINRFENSVLAIFFLLLMGVVFRMTMLGVSERIVTLIFLLMLVAFLIAMLFFYTKLAKKMFPEKEEQKPE
jgi:hypothetical protein